MRITPVRLILIVIGLVLIAGCRGTVQLGLERTPTPDRSIPATLDALRAENARLATRVAERTVELPSALELGQLAYVQGGDIWTLPLFNEAASPQRLTVDGYNREPRWSASGKWLAFRKERPVTSFGANVQGPASSAPRPQIWLIQADGGGEHPLYQGLSVETIAWSPVADRLAYTTAGNGLQVINADGTDLIVLLAEDTAVPAGERQIGQIFWSPDGRWIAYEWRIQPASRPPVYQGLWLVSAEGGKSIELYAAGLPDKSEVTLLGWSTPGDAIFFVQDPLSSEPPIDGGRLYRVSTTVPLSPTVSARLIESDAVLPYIDFVAPNPLLAAWQERDSVAYVVGAGRSTWTNKRIKTEGRFITGADLAAISPVWAPAGDRLAYAAMTDRGDLAPGDVTTLMPRRIWIAQAVGDPKPRALTNSNTYRDERPLWSADGDYLLFARLDARGRASLWIMPAGGGVPRQVVDELTPAPDPYEMFGHVNWSAYYDWWRGP